MMKHTAGPWRWLDGNSLMGDHGRRPIVLTAREMKMTGDDGMLKPNNPKSPDSLLISAAPELLEALKRADTELRLRIGLVTNRTQDEKELLVMIYNAITKATGGVKP